VKSGIVFNLTSLTLDANKLVQLIAMIRMPVPETAVILSPEIALILQSTAMMETLALMTLVILLLDA